MDDDLMTSAELACTLDALGLNREESAAALGVSLATVKNWLTGKHRIPAGVVDDLDALKVEAARWVNRVAVELDGMEEPRVVVWRSGEAMWAAWPELAGRPARWWRHVVSRAVERSASGGVRVVFGEDQAS